MNNLDIRYTLVDRYGDTAEVYRPQLIRLKEIYTLHPENIRQFDYIIETLDVMVIPYHYGTIPFMEVGDDPGCFQELTWSSTDDLLGHIEELLA